MSKDESYLRIKKIFQMWEISKVTQILDFQCAMDPHSHFMVLLSFKCKIKLSHEMLKSKIQQNRVQWHWWYSEVKFLKNIIRTLSE